MLWRKDGRPHGILSGGGADVQEELERFFSEHGFSCSHEGGEAEWPRPEGTMEAPYDRDVLRRTDLASSVEAFDNHQRRVDVMNKIGLHNCSAYCCKCGRPCKFGFGEVSAAGGGAEDARGLRGGKCPHCDFRVTERADGRLDTEGPRNHKRALNIAGPHDGVGRQLRLRSAADACGPGLARPCGPRAVLENLAVHRGLRVQGRGGRCGRGGAG